MGRFKLLSGSVLDRLAGADERILELLGAWLEVRGNRTVPLKRDFDPIAVAPLMPYLWLYQYDGEKGDFVCKLAGEEVNNAWGESIRGATLRQIVGEEDHPMVLTRWHYLIATPAIHYGPRTEKFSKRPSWHAERLVLPLLHPEDTVDHLLGISLYQMVRFSDDTTASVSQEVIQIPCSDL